MGFTGDRGGATEGWRLRKDGSRFRASVTISAIKHPEGRVAGFLKIVRDLTDRQESTEALRQSEERFRLLIESVSTMQSSCWTRTGSS